MPVVALLGECDYNRSLFGFMPGSIAWCKMIPLLVVIPTHPESIPKIWFSAIFREFQTFCMAKKYWVTPQSSIQYSKRSNHSNQVVSNITHTTANPPSIQFDFYKCDPGHRHFMRWNSFWCNPFRSVLSLYMWSSGNGTSHKTFLVSHCFAWALNFRPPKYLKLRARAELCDDWSWFDRMYPI